MTFASGLFSIESGKDEETGVVYRGPRRPVSGKKDKNVPIDLALVSPE